MAGRAEVSDRLTSRLEPLIDVSRCHRNPGARAINTRQASGEYYVIADQAAARRSSSLAACRCGQTGSLVRESGERVEKISCKPSDLTDRHRKQPQTAETLNGCLNCQSTPASELAEGFFSAGWVTRPARC